MISSRHDIVQIEFWLKNWIKLGAKTPNIVVCDNSRALLNAIISAFSKKSFSEYVNYLFAAIINDSKPDILVRIDICHFVKNVASIQV